ncbi:MULTISPECIES: hypothetical protein [Asaia]|uniref:Uncharacterized protein n=1 Tax=Asaia spathodeae TaxID=657016 RepID=A0ABX2P811_9PROT|nr:hypothetical protein [Asaia spathodeae]GBR20150.1 hypothetical protein AA105894_2485 [Asaia spathodeae NBRC 105894]
MSDAANTIAQKPAARKYTKGEVRRFKEAEERVKSNNRPTLESVMALTPTEDRISLIISRLGLDAGDTDELIGLGSNMIRDQYNAMFSILAWTGRDGLQDLELKIHLDRLVEALVCSAHYSAKKYEAKRAIAADARSAFSNPHRDESRAGPDGDRGRVENLARVAASTAARSYAVSCVAQGACAAYKELMGKDWQPYVPNNRRSVEERAGDAIFDALGI